MDLTFDEEQRVFKETFREFMQKECPRELVERAESDGSGFAPEAWKKMAELGWLGLGFMEEEPGGGNMVLACILCEEMGRVLLPVPYVSSVVIAARAVWEGAAEPARTRIVEAIDSGDCVVAPALVEKERYLGLDSVECEARPENGGYVLKGRKTFVEVADSADYILVPAVAPEGLTAFLVEPDAEGVRLEPLETMGGEGFFDVALDGATADPELMLGRPGEGLRLLEPLVDRARVALSAKMLGGTDAVLEMSAQYARERVQFNRPIGSFQAISFGLADLATGLSGGRLLTYKAAWMIDEGKGGVAREAAMAKAFASELYREASDFGVHVHGGYGFMTEYDAQLYFRRAKADELALGDGAFNRSLLFGREGRYAPG